jgi:arylformamidase
MSVNQSSGQSVPASVEMNQVWDVGRLVDLTVDFHNGMPVDVSAPLPSFELRELEEEMAALCKGLAYRSYSQEMRMCVQAGNHLETGAHLYREMESVADIGLERLFLSTVLLYVPKGKDEKVSGRDLEEALSESGEEIGPGEAILIATGYNRYASGDQKAELTPHFSYDAIEWVVGHAPAILASDMANWYDGVEEPNFWPMLLKSGTLVAGSLVNLSEITETRFRLIALPMKIRGAMAAPVRMIAVLPSTVH